MCATFKSLWPSDTLTMMTDSLTFRTITIRSTTLKWSEFFFPVGYNQSINRWNYNETQSIQSNNDVNIKRKVINWCRKCLQHSVTLQTAHVSQISKNTRLIQDLPYSVLIVWSPEIRYNTCVLLLKPTRMARCAFNTPWHCRPQTFQKITQNTLLWFKTLA